MIGMLALVGAVVMAPSSQATPLMAAGAATNAGAAMPNTVEPVRWRRHYRYGGYHHYRHRYYGYRPYGYYGYRPYRYYGYRPYRYYGYRSWGYHPWGWRHRGWW